MKDIKVTRTATGSIADELRDMDVGDVVAFDATEYKASSVRGSAYSTLLEQRFEGWRWKTSLDIPGKRLLVKRIS